MAMQDKSKKTLGAPLIWSEPKKARHITLTDTGFQGLDELARERELSRSELVERIGRKLIQLPPPDDVPQPPPDDGS